jgi:plastocyanin
MLQATGASVFVVAAAGCLGDDDGESDDNGEDDGNGDNADGEFKIDPGTEVVLDGYSSHWEGVEPSDIDGEQNPTLVLEDGGDYTIEWINADGVNHDLQIWDEDDELIDDLATESISDEGEGDSLSFTADAEMATYVCEYHATNQVGDLVVE